MRIAVYAIALNEQAFAERFMASCRDADLVLVADTGSTDSTVQRLRTLGADVRHIRIAPWRFDHARNAALNLVPQDVDVCVSLDLDQTLSHGWRPLIEAAWAKGATQLYYTHVFTQPGASGPVIFQDNRIHARTGFAWDYPCHECLIPLWNVRHQAETDLRLKVLHAPDLTKSRGSYLLLLELGVRERPNDARAAHYLGREYYYLKRYREAAREFERYIALSPDDGGYERNGTRRLLAHCREELGDLDGALAEFEAAVTDGPHMRGAWLSLAWAYHRRAAWADCLTAAERAISLRDDEAHYGDDSSPGVVAEDLACLASWSLGHPLTAWDYARDALKKAPGNPRLLANLARIEAALKREGPQAFGVSLKPLDEAGKPIETTAQRPSPPEASPRRAADPSRSAPRRVRSGQQAKS
ncbi:MAG TPA: glycosyltransferase [Caulobacteraceae bacterium]|nr:glycosyltransferase [Caulobacteraceae bacterium]